MLLNYFFCMKWDKIVIAKLYLHTHTSAVGSSNLDFLATLPGVQRSSKESQQLKYIMVIINVTNLGLLSCSSKHTVYMYMYM